MKFYTRTIATTACLLGLAALTPAISKAEDATATTTSPTTPAKKSRKGGESHPAIANAIKELEAANKHLKEAAHDFGGHKEKAIKACEDAISQLKEAEKFDKK